MLAVHYQRFAVNSCLDNVNERRREAMANLRRQEIVLNEQERQRNHAPEGQPCPSPYCNHTRHAGFCRTTFWSVQHRETDLTAA